MNQYLLATYAVGDEVEGAPQTQEDMQAFLERVMAVETAMDEAGAFVFGGALTAPEAASVHRAGGIAIDGPFAETKEQMAGFYIINAADDTEAATWAARVVEAIRHPIEVRAFRATGRVQV